MEATVVTASTISLFFLPFLVAHFIATKVPKILPELPGRSASIDGLRGYLALAVVCHHFPILREANLTGVVRLPASVPLANLGPSAVAVFFMITAYLFYGKILREKEAINFSSLYAGRLFRLAPMYVLLVALLTLISFAHAGFQLQTSPDKLASALMRWLTFTLLGAPEINGFPDTGQIAGIVWSLRYEWLFYALLPGIALLPRLSGRFGRIAVLIAVAAAMMLLPPFGALGFSSKTAMPFLLGMLTVEIVAIPSVKTRLADTPFSVIAILSLCLAIFSPGNVYGELRILALFLVFAPIAAGNDCFGLLTNRGSRLLGDATYSIYLLHCFVLYCYFKFSGNTGYMTWVALPLLGGFISALSIGTYVTVEKRAMDSGARWINRAKASRVKKASRETP